MMRAKSEHGKMFTVNGLKAVEEDKSIHIAVGTYLLSLRGEKELIHQFLPYLRFEP